MRTINLANVSGEAELSDEAVVSRVLAGEVSLYELLMRRHNQKLYRAIRSYLKNEQEVEDAMQDTYLKGYEKLYQFRHDAQFSTWLIRIGINTALAKLRENRRVFPFSLLVDQPADISNILTQTNFMSPEHIAIQQEVKQLLEKAIDSIPEKYRIIYTLREVEGMPVSEITQCLDLSESNVKVRLHRAKAMLKDSLFKLSATRDVFEFGNKRCDAIVEHVMKNLPADKKL
ncbi:RNA polymerase sigma factor [Pontibacter sp. BT310]|uniref:RNA polymerase sigma factor n=1 Tax=Pontibacter populi TaxID=890055 RepID=A0ABS6XAW3_9BACT|nr:MULTISPECIES: RNA polymerase sigma factor [Pontibacter]MBJ6118189.1 RNA polymerase sigma factor [Pontibacter sp. BT310]MBR0570616.1 RNA polymerase sigma factor [Microvirga sp. STS03]MBW3365042.1 RNA polymerase sigma factor [Pontibacter populi]